MIVSTIHVQEYVLLKMIILLQLEGLFSIY